jgi:hypothetical protein
MADAADKLVTPWECPGEDCNSSALTATDMVNVFGHYFTAAKPNVFIFFETCGACNKDVKGVRCVDCPESADTHEEAQIKFGEDYANKKRRVKKGKKTDLRCRKCMEKLDAKDELKKQKLKKDPVKKKDGTKRELDVPTASSDSDDEGDSKSGKADKSPKRNKAQSPSPSPSSAKKAATKSTTRKRASKKK